MLRLEDALVDLHELDAMARVDDEADYYTNPRRYDSEYRAIARRVVAGMHERLPLSDAWLPWWLGVVQLSAAETSRDLGIPRRTLTIGGALTAAQLASAAELVGGMLRRRHGRVLRRYADESIDLALGAQLAWNPAPELATRGWRVLCRELAEHDRVLVLLAGQLPYATPAGIPLPSAEPGHKPAAVTLPPGTMPPRPPRPLVRCPACAAQWRPRVDQPVKCPQCQYRFGWPA